MFPMSVLCYSIVATGKEITPYPFSPTEESKMHCETGRSPFYIMHIDIAGDTKSVHN